MRKTFVVFLSALLLPLSANAVCDAGYQLNISTGLCEACPAGTYSDGTAITLDISIGGNGFTPRQPDGGTTWSTTFDYGTIYGISGCNPNSYTFLENSTGDYCWCKITSTTNTNWTYVYAYDYDETTCSSTCAHACGYFMYQYEGTRRNVCSSATCQSCTGLPANAHWTGNGTNANNCSWECDAGYESTGSSCKACSDYNTTENSSDTENVYTASGYNTGTRTRSKSRAVYYSSSAGGSCSISSYGDWSYGSWSYVCIAGGAYYDGNTCEWTPTGYYSPANDNGIYECTNKPSNSSYIPNAGADGNYCPWACDNGYVKYNNACHQRCPVNEGRIHADQYSHPLFADKTNMPSPVLHIQYVDGTMCYGYLEPGFAPTGEHGIHIFYNGAVYHAVNPGD